MSAWILALIFKPLASFLILGGIALPIRWLVWHKMPEGKIKNALLKNRWGQKDSLSR